MYRFTIVLCLTVLVFLTGVSLADIPKLINYQGMLTDELGDPITDTLDLEFRIYNSETNGDLKWSETQNQVPIIDGLFSVILGSENLIDTLSFSEQYWLEVQVDNDTMPRLRFTSVGYAYRAKVADSAVVAGSAGGSNWSVTGSVIYTDEYWGIARGGAGNVFHGDSTHTMVNLGVVCTTGQNGQNDYYSTVSGGYGNAAHWYFSTVAGGRKNRALSTGSTVGGGTDNLAIGDRSVVAGGYVNAARGYMSAVGGGYQDTARAVYAGVFCGYSNLAGDETTDTAAFVGGGYDNSATGQFATVTGGRENNASSNWAAIGGGRYNVASHTCATIAGGYSNDATAWYTVIGGGQANNASEGFSTIGGGFSNDAMGRYGTIAGGYQNSAGNQAGDTAAFVGGGSYNAAIAMFGTVCGGHGNYNEGEYSVICGGYKDTLTSGADHSMAFGEGVYVDTSYRVVFFDGGNSGRLGINRDDREGGVNYPIHVGTDATNGNGAHLTAEGAWNGPSSRSFKTDFHSLDGEQILAQISNLPVESWRYKGSRGRHIGPYAEDFVEIFEVGTAREDGTIEDKYLSATDLAGVSLAGVKALIRQNQELRHMVEELSQKMAELERSK